MSAWVAESPEKSLAATAESRAGHWAEHRRVFGNAATVGALTSMAKLAGLAKVMAEARFFGTSDALDAFLIAFLLPSFLSDVVAGSFTPGLIPLLVREQAAGGDLAVRRLMRGALAVALTVMLAAAAGLALTGGWLVPLAGSSFSAGKLRLATTLFFGLLFWLPMSACIATWRAALNAGGRFALAAIAPLAIVVLLYAFARRYGAAVLCAGTVGGVATECLLLALAVRRMGQPIVPSWRDWTCPQLRSLRRQYLPLVASAIISSGCLIVDQSMAGRLGAGRVSALVYGNKVPAVLMAVVASAVSTAVLPAFSRLAAAGQWKRLRRTVLMYSGSITLLILPLTVVLTASSGVLVRLFFEHGAFQAPASALVTKVQRFALLGAPFAVLLAIATRLTAALSANRLLIWMGAAALLTDIVLDAAFSRWMGVAGIALASPCVQCVSLCVLVLLLRRHRPEVFSERA